MPFLTFHIKYRLELSFESRICIFNVGCSKSQCTQLVDGLRLTLNYTRVINLLSKYQPYPFHTLRFLILPTQLNKSTHHKI